MMNILVLGASGMAGHLISIYFQEKGHSVTGYSRKYLYYCPTIIGDALDSKNLLKTITSADYDVVINCIGILNTEAEVRKSEAVYLNSYLPHLISKTLVDRKAKLIHMSTDCVFAGNTGPYYEDSLRDGQSFYDRTKALGEIEDDRNITLRNSIIGPDVNKDGIGLFNWFMKQNQPIKGYQGAIWTGVTTLELAKAMEHVIHANDSGLYNLVNNTSISKYDLLKLINKYFKSDRIIINANNEYQVDKSLRTNRMISGYSVGSYEQMMIELRKWVFEHRDLYPHYFS